MSEALTLQFLRSRLLPDTATGCHEWTFSLDKKGYGQVRHMGRTYKVHRLVYALAKGDPGGLMVCHSCDNPSCANEDHLFLGTALDNVTDMHDKGRDRKVGRKGVLHHSAQLTEPDVLAIRKSSEAGVALAKHYGVSTSTISNIRIGKTWSHVKGESE